MTVEQWLGKDNLLGIDIWMRKYRKGEESFDEWLDRVSGGNKRVKNAIISKKFVPGGRILSNRGIKDTRVTYSNCFMAGSKVLTIDGFKNIEDIAIGDMVLSHDEQFHRVNDIMCREYTGDIYCLESINFMEPIKCTPNHKILTNHGWKRADRILACSEQIKAQDKIKMAQHHMIKFTPKIVSALDGFKARDNSKVEVKDGMAQIYTLVNDRGTTTYQHRGNSVRAEWVFDDDFAYFIGRWLGDGSITARRGYKNPSILQIVFNATTERDAFERCKSIGENVFGIHASYRETNQNVIALRFESEIIASWFVNHFGEKCDGKFVPNEYLGCVPMMVGLCDADGTLDTHGAFRIVLKNRKLIDWLYYTMWMNGINASPIHSVERQADTYEFRVGVAISNKFLNPLLSKQYSDGRNNLDVRGDFEYAALSSISISEDCHCKVYNLSVEDTHTYNVNGVIVHNCYVIAPPEDNIESIFESRKKLARTYSYGGGCGIDISKLAPAGAKVHNQAEKTSGAVSFMQGYSQTTEEIGQNGRRGALMISLDCHHPDLMDFIDIKTKENSVTKANISVRVTDDFMQAVEDNTDWVMSFTRPETGETITKTAKARDIFDKLCENNWNWAEPGILFWDNIEEYNLLSNNPDFEYAGTNPCAEEPLPAGGSCLLGSINLSAFVDDCGDFMYDDFYETVDTGIRYLNEVLDEGLPLHPLQEQRDSVRDWRQVGLGVCGVADMLIKMHLRYDSDEAIEHCRDISIAMANHAMYVSANLACEKGPYPKYTKGTITTPFFRANADTLTKNMVENYGLRNSQLLTIAPTGTISTMLGISGGIEPIFAKSYKRKTESLHETTQYYDVLTPIYQKYADEHGLTVNDKFPDWFVDSSEIDYNKRVAMQAAWQKGIDASISSTVNLPNEATIDDVKNIYMSAWKNGLKGITIYRSGCKREGVLIVEDKNKEEIQTEESIPRGAIMNCSDDLVGKKRKLTTGCGSLHVLAFFDPYNGDLQEVYFNKGSTGGCANFMTGLSRTVSLLCRAGVDIATIKDQLDSSGVCPSYAARTATKHDTSKGSCCPMAIGNALMDMYKEMQEDVDDDYDEDYKSYVMSQEKLNSIKLGVCPECGEPMTHEGGCDICKSCGYSHCG